MKHLLFFLLAIFAVCSACAQLPKVYDESLDPMAQIDSALVIAQAEGKFVICQVGGNWCPWCLRFADFIKTDQEIAEIVEKNFVYIHVNYPRTGAPEALLARLGNPGRFGYPVLVVLDTDGRVIHIQDSGYLEKDEGYDSEKVARFFHLWSPEAVNPGVKD